MTLPIEKTIKEAKEKEEKPLKEKSKKGSKTGDALLPIVRELFKSKRNVAILLIVVLLSLFFLASDGEGESITQKTDTSDFSAEYTKALEKKLEKLLSGIEGAGEVRVMISLESCYENVYLSETSDDEKRTDTSSEIKKDEQYVTLKKGTSTEECVVVKVYEPVVRGVAVAAEGAGSELVKKSLTDTVCAVFSISSTRVSVEKLSKQ